MPTYESSRINEASRRVILGSKPLDIRKKKSLAIKSALMFYPPPELGELKHTPCRMRGPACSLLLCNVVAQHNQHGPAKFRTLAQDYR